MRCCLKCLAEIIHAVALCLGKQLEHIRNVPRESPFRLVQGVQERNRLVGSLSAVFKAENQAGLLRAPRDRGIHLKNLGKRVRPHGEFAAVRVVLRMLPVIEAPDKPGVENVTGADDAFKLLLLGLSARLVGRCTLQSEDRMTPVFSPSESSVARSFLSSSTESFSIGLSPILARKSTYSIPHGELREGGVKVLEKFIEKN